MRYALYIQLEAYCIDTPALSQLQVHCIRYNGSEMIGCGWFYCGPIYSCGNLSCAGPAHPRVYCYQQYMHF